MKRGRRKVRDPKRYDSNDVDTAMCAWEHIVERLARGQDAGEDNRWERLREQHGTASLRDWVIDQIDVINNAWKIAAQDGDRFCGSFDWEFVPKFLECAYDDELELRIEWEDIAEQIGAEGL
jgi:hypothetical protein